VSDPSSIGGPDTFIPGYHARIRAVEEDHWWHRGMRSLSAALLEDRLRRRDQVLLDAGCGTGGFLRWALELPAFGAGAGIDVSPEGIELARRQVPGADLRVGSVTSLPYADASFDVAVCNDVLQHLGEHQAPAALRELRRVLRPGGTLLVRTRGVREVHADWHAYDRARLRAALYCAGLAPSVVTYANLVGSALSELGRRAPRKLERREAHGIPKRVSGRRAVVGTLLLEGEAFLLRRTRLSIPFGHTVLARAERPADRITR
jgi:ubiquinone/menaquinone biosynthesis C-methylase UbiE